MRRRGLVCQVQPVRVTQFAMPAMGQLRWTALVHDVRSEICDMSKIGGHYCSRSLAAGGRGSALER